MTDERITQDENQPAVTEQGTTIGTDRDTTVDRAPAGDTTTHADTDMAGTAPSGELEDQ